MSRDRRRSPRFESLEGKQLLSSLAAGAPRPAAVASLPLDGMMAASSFGYTRNNGSAETAKIGMSGFAGSMGAVNGVLTEGIDVAVEVVSKANLVLANQAGSVTLTLSHLVIMQNLTMPWNMGYTADYTITSGTGAYAHAHGTGTIDVAQDIGDLGMHFVLHTSR